MRLCGPLELMGSNEALSQGQKLLGLLNLRFIGVDENILSQAQGLISKYSLKPRDAIHVASAINRKLEISISDNQDLDSIKEVTRISLYNR